MNIKENGVMETPELLGQHREGLLEVATLKVRPDP